MTELQLLQYRTTYVNGTPIVREDCNFTMDERLRLVTVALCKKGDPMNTSLEYLNGNRHSIWPSKMCMQQQKN